MRSWRRGRAVFWYSSMLDDERWGIHTLDWLKRHDWGRDVTSTAMAVKRAEIEYGHASDHRAFGRGQTFQQATDMALTLDVLPPLDEDADPDNEDLWYMCSRLGAVEELPVEGHRIIVEDSPLIGDGSDGKRKGNRPASYYHIKYP